MIMRRFKMNDFLSPVGCTSHNMHICKSVSLSSMFPNRIMGLPFSDKITPNCCTCATFQEIRGTQTLPGQRYTNMERSGFIFM